MHALGEALDTDVLTARYAAQDAGHLLGNTLELAQLIPECVAHLPKYLRLRIDEVIREDDSEGFLSDHGT